MSNARPQTNEREESHPLLGMANLMVHPMAGFAAGSALGFGMAGHIAGMWFGLMAGAMERAGSGARAARTLEARAAPAARGDEIARAKAQVIELSQAQERRAASTARRAKGEREARPITRATARSAGAKAVQDDLKRITGIGPKLEQVLATRGLDTFAAIASLTTVQIATLEEELGFPGRIARDQWIEQARRFMGGRAR